jgi:urea transport system substrate-binding protein
MVHGYIDVLIWAAAVKKAGTFDPAAVKKAAVQLSLDSAMGTVKFADNQSLYQTAYVGQLQPNGQFAILWQSKGALRPEPYDALAFPGKSCVIK